MKIYATFHPASVLEGGFQLERYIQEDFQRLKQKQLQPPYKNFPRVNTHVVGFDTEYAPDGKLLTVGLADNKRAAAIETSNPGWRKRVRSFIKSATTLVGHSVDGDVDYLVKYGLAKESWLRGENIRDSLLLARMVDENRGKGGYALEPLFLSEFNFAPWKRPTAELLKKDPDASKWPVALRTDRCRIDAWATRLLGEKYLLRVEEQIREVRKRRLN